MAYAQKIREDDSSLYLKVNAALGYGSTDMASRAKLGGVYPEPIVEGTTVSCVSVFNNTDLEKLDKKKVRDVWTVLYQHMLTEAEENEYNTLNHNCCTVAYSGIKNIDGHIERINETRDFNLEGMGVTWGATFGTIVGFSSSSSSSSYPTIVEASKSVFGSSSSSSSSFSGSAKEHTALDEKIFDDDQGVEQGKNEDL